MTKVLVEVKYEVEVEEENVESFTKVLEDATQENSYGPIKGFTATRISQRVSTDDLTNEHVGRGVDLYASTPSEWGWGTLGSTPSTSIIKKIMRFPDRIVVEFVDGSAGCWGYWDILTLT